MIDFEPDDEQKLIVETVRAFAEQEIRPRARAAEEARALPEGLLDRAHALGLVAACAEAQGPPPSALTGALIAEELAWGDLACAVAILSPALSALPLQRHAPAERRADWLAPYRRERFVPGALAWVEPRFDHDPLRPRTRAQRDDGGYRIDGRKCFVPWLPGGEDLLLVAECEGRPALLRLPRSAPGLRSEAERNMGLGALPTAEIVCDGVRADADALLAGADVVGLLCRGRVALAALAVGVARAAYEIARDYAKERQAFGGPIAAKQAIAFKLADMAIEIDGARLLTWEAAWRLDEGEDARAHALRAQQQAARVALEVADGAIQVLGGHGYIRDYLPELQLRNARGFAHFEALALV